MGFLDKPADWMFFAGIALLTVIMLRKWYGRYSRRGRRRSARRQRKEEKAAVAARTAPSSNVPLIDAPVDTLRWQVEMHDLARDLKAELDTKIAILQSVTAKAKQERERLEDALRQSEELRAAAKPPAS